MVRAITRVMSLLLGGMVVGCSTTFAKDASRQAMTPQQAAYVPDTLILKLTPDAGKALDTALQSTQAPMPSGLAWLEALNTRYGVTTIAPLFPHQSDVEEIKRKYPERARRAPGGAPLPPLNYVYKLTLAPDADVLHAAADYGAQPDVEYAQPDYLATTQQGGATLP